MSIEVKQALSADQLRLHNLLQFYIYDFTAFLPFDLNPQGLFDQSILTDYFDNPDKTAFLVFADNQLAGFVLVSPETTLKANEGGKCIKEFFIVKRYRRNGIGKAVAARVFSMYQGKWEVRVLKLNQPAPRFWEATISQYSKGRYEKADQDDDAWRGSIFSFAVEPTVV